MRTQYFTSMLDGAKILFSARNNFTHIRNHATAVGAVGAMKFFDKIQVMELLPIKNNIVSAPDFFDAVNGETSHLIKTDEYIRHQ